MKFEKRFQIEVVPEWRIKYIDYKGLKKKLRQVHREKLTRDKEFVQNDDLSSNSSRPHSARLEGTEISSPLNDKRMSFQSQQRTFTMNSVADSVHDFFHKVSSALVTLQRNPGVSSRNIPPPQKITSLDTLMDQVDSKERLFFTALDVELDKIEHFYKFKEIEATNRMNMLVQQYEILKEKKDGEDENEKKQSFEVWNTPKALVKQSIDYFTSSNLKGSVSTISLNTPEERQRYYNAAKKNIKKAVFEFYRGAELLKKYKTLNYNGFSKILKKYDKISERNGSEIYMQKVTNSYFVKSKTMKKLIKDAEDFYVTHFESGSRSRALRNLRTPNKENKTYYHSILRVGLYLGLALPPLVHASEKAWERVNKDNDRNNWMTLVEIYSAMFLPLIFLLLLGASMYIWTRLHINYKFIFEFDSRSNLDFRQYLELPTIIFLVTSYIMFFNLQNEIVYIASYTYPIILVIFIIAVLFNPFRILYYDARKWFIFSVARLFGSGILRVEFRDFFIADILTSLSYSLSTLRFFGCLNEGIEINKCNTKWSPGLGSVPALLRFLQSYKRYRDTHQVNHLINLGKYGLIIAGIWMSYAYHITLSKNGEDYSMTMKVLWMITQTIASIYTFSWDVKMDWSLFRLDSMNYLLRDELGFEHRRLYYFAIISNFILRISWVLLITNSNPVIIFIVAFGEMLRRFQWCLLRVENEHVNNCGQFRAVKEIPLPFQVDIAKADNADFVNTDYDRTPSLASWSSWSKRLFAKRKLNPADSWRDFEPTKNTSEYLYPDEIYEESDEDSYDSDEERNKRNTIFLARMDGGHGLSNTYASRSFLPVNKNS